VAHSVCRADPFHVARPCFGFQESITFPLSSSPSGTSGWVYWHLPPAIFARLETQDPWSFSNLWTTCCPQSRLAAYAAQRLRGSQCSRAGRPLGTRIRAGPTERGERGRAPTGSRMYRACRRVRACHMPGGGGQRTPNKGGSGLVPKRAGSGKHAVGVCDDGAGARGRGDAGAGGRE
jgi:hypothetical protein